MSLNDSQRVVLWAGAAITVAAILFPPMHIQSGNGISRGHHIGFLFQVGEREDFRFVVNHSLLAVELAGIAIAVALSFVALSSPQKPVT